MEGLALLAAGPADACEAYVTSEAIYARCLLFYEWAVRAAEGVGTCVGDSWPLVFLRARRMLDDERID